MSWASNFVLVRAARATQQEQACRERKRGDIAKDKERNTYLRVKKRRNIEVRVTEAERQRYRGGREARGEAAIQGR